MLSNYAPSTSTWSGNWLRGNMPWEAEGLKAFLSLSFPRLILGNFGKKPFPEFLKAFPDLESDL